MAGRRRGNDEVASKNIKEIGKVRSKYARARNWMYFWVAFIPLGIIIGCGGGMAFPPLFVLGLLAPFISLGGILLMASDRGRWTRALAVANIADEMGCSYTQAPTEKQYGFLTS